MGCACESKEDARPAPSRGETLMASAWERREEQGSGTSAGGDDALPARAEHGDWSGTLAVKAVRLPQSLSCILRQRARNRPACICRRSEIHLLMTARRNGPRRESTVCEPIERDGDVEHMGP